MDSQSQPVSTGAGPGRVLRLAAGASVLLYGVWMFDRASTPWALLSIGLHALPLALQAVRGPMLRVYALWFGVLLVAQSLLSPLVRSGYVSLPPNMHSTVDLRTPDAPGMPPGVRHITTDAKGYRVTPAVNYERKQGTRIFAIGGSTTEDIVLDDRATWTHLLQEGLKARGHAVEVINTGVSGLRARNHLATLAAVAQYQPDIVVVLAGANDWNKHILDHFQPGRDPYRPATLRVSALGKLLARYVVGPLRARFLEAPSHDRSVVVHDPDAFNAHKPMRALDRSVKRVFRPVDVSEGYRDDMLDLSQRCKALGVRCLFLTQPHAYGTQVTPRLRNRYWMTPPYADYTLDLASMMQIAALYNAWVQDMARREGHQSCDVAGGMAPTEELFFDDMHYTDAGARRVAELVLPCVARLLER